MIDNRRTDEEILAEARARFFSSHNADAKYRLAALDDLKFYDGDQWPTDIRAQREDDGRPCLTFPVIQQFVRQISNEIRKNKPSPVVTPVGHEDVDTADVIMGIERKIERQSKADIARSYAALYAIITGRGWYRITTRYESEGLDGESFGEEIFDQEIFIDRIKNQLGVYPDPTAQQPDYSDMKFCFVVEDWLTEEYKKEHPNSEAASLEEFSSLGDQAPLWFGEKTIRIAEYFSVETDRTEVALVHLPDVETTFVMPLKDVPEGAEIIKKRTVKRKVVCWYKMNGVEILDRKIWPIEWIPIIPVLGEELQINGETSLSGMVRGIKSAQMQYNFMRTMQVETISLAPRNPYIAAEGQLEGFETQWQKANVKNFAVLQYKPKSLNGVLVPPPQRQQFEPAIQATTIAVGQAYEDLKRGSGIHDASLGARSNETSGRAILAREEQGDTANFHFQDNLTTAINHEMRMTVALMPLIYDRPGRIVQIIGEEGEEKPVTLNAPTMIKGEERVIDIRAGRYDVAVDVGVNYKTQRKLQGETLMELTRAYPEMMAVAGDLLVKTLDMPGARELSERLKKMLPPQLQEQDEQEAPIPPQAQQQIAQMQAEIEQLVQALEDATDQITNKKVEAQSREKIVFMQEETKRLIANAQLGSREDLELLKHEITRIQTQLAQTHAIETQERQHEYEAGQAEAARMAQQATAAGQGAAA